MILFVLLVAILLVLGLATVLTVGTFGAGAIILFGDVFVCIGILIWIIKKLLKK